MYDDFEEKDCRYFTTPPKEWIDLLMTLEARDDRRRAAYEAKNPAAKKNKA